MPAPDPIRSPATHEGWRVGELWVLFGITMLGAALRLFRVEQWSMAAAEVATWQAVTMPLEGDGGFFASAASQYPLVHLGLRWLLDTGLLGFDGQGWLRLPFVFFGTISVPLAALAASLMVGRRTALLAAGLLALHPWHIVQSQTAAPPVVALAFALLAMVAGLAAPRRWRWSRRAVCVVAAALACACDRSGLLVLPLLAAGWLAGPGLRGRGRVLSVAGLLTTATLPAALHVVCAWPFAGTAADAASWWWFAWLARPQVLLLALLAAWIRRPVPWTVLAAAALPVLGLGVAALFGAGVEPIDLLLTLPPSLLLAAAAVVGVADRVRAAAPGVPGWIATALVPLVLITSLAVDAVLLGTVYEGQRSPWQQAANLALAAHTSADGLVVGGREGAPSLTFYLRPNHWRDPGGDARPGVRVVELGPGLRDGLADLLAGAGDGAVRIVLRRDELEQLERDDSARQLLHDACTLLRVLPCPRENGDGTLYVFASRAQR